MKDFIRIRGLSKHFGDFVAVDNVDLDIARGELFSILGGSGCGKTTLLRMLAGFEVPTSGTIEIDGVDVTRQPPYERHVNMMFQSYAVFPHMNVERNIGYGLRKEKVPAAEIAKRVDAMLDLVQLGDYRRRKPDQLSGGQRQRVALARALIKRLVKEHEADAFGLTPAGVQSRISKLKNELAVNNAAERILGVRATEVTGPGRVHLPMHRGRRAIDLR